MIFIVIFWGSIRPAEFKEYDYYIGMSIGVSISMLYDFMTKRRANT